jgi:nicotinate-nucleotide adenylyltransferase
VTTYPSADRAQAVLGGTFDPIHFGHLRLAEEMADFLGLSVVRLVPAGDPYHRSLTVATAAQRLAMVRLAIQGNPRLIADDREVRQDRPSYTVETLESLRFEAAGPWVLLLGSDAFAGLAGWRRWRDILALAHVAVAERPGASAWRNQLGPELKAEFATRHSADPGVLTRERNGCIVVHCMTPLDISATAIRVFLREHRSPRYLLPDAVLTYIEEHDLYR